MALAEAIRAGRSGPVLRFYHWRPACVTLGRFQPAEGNVKLEACTALGIDVAKRPTGGRAILHDDEVTFSLILRDEDLPDTGRGVMDSYRALGAGLVAGLRKLGLPAELVDHHAQTRGGDPTSVMAAGNPACFAAKARCDLMVGDKKLVGSAQMRAHGIILQQNSLPLRIDFPRWDEVFHRADWEAVRAAGATDLLTAAGRAIGEAEVVAALRDGIADALGITFVDDDFTAEEAARADVLEGQYAVG